MLVHFKHKLPDKSMSGIRNKVMHRSSSTDFVCVCLLACSFVCRWALWLKRPIDEVPIHIYKKLNVPEQR